MNTKLTKDFYTLSALELAPMLIGKLLCVATDGNVIRARITQTECYCGETDTASHAKSGRTKRTLPLYREGGVAYVYLCYGIHALFNVVCSLAEDPQSVFIRGVEGYDSPARLTKALGIDKTFNEEDLCISNRVWIEDDGYRPQITTAPRVGIDYASQTDRAKLWRFIAK